MPRYLSFSSHFSFFKDICFPPIFTTDHLLPSIFRFSVTMIRMIIVNLNSKILSNQAESMTLSLFISMMNSRALDNKTIISFSDKI